MCKFVFIILEGKDEKVITYGTFDLLHVGHINILRRAKELGDYLLVVLSTDEFNAIKNKKHTIHMRIGSRFLKR